MSEDILRTVLEAMAAMEKADVEGPYVIELGVDLIIAIARGSHTYAPVISHSSTTMTLYGMKVRSSPEPGLIRIWTM